MNREYNYDNVYLIPQKSVVNSRSECDITVELKNYTFRNPVVAANMKSIVDEDTCVYFASKGMFYIMHRFGVDQKSFVSNMKEKGLFASISIGIKEEDKKTINEFSKEANKPDFITIDIAHAHCDKTREMIFYIKDKLPGAFVIVGNIATKEAASFLEESGADCLKIFIAPGAACSTKIKTGFTRGTITCLQEIVQGANVPIIADGGIRNSGDIAKAMACGADMVMSGFFMSGFDQNSGQIILIEGEKKYLYYGSASFNMKRHNKHIEGTEILVDYKGDMDDHIEDIECSLKSAVSYAGVKNIKDMYGTPLFYME